jgi:general secretion pathway protein A
MYKNYFGLSQSPFSIAPNPHFLFMSDRHREALSHLTYGLGDTGGFVLLTGEVGTGKTTISRCLLTQLPENTQSALILNPTLSSQELLATVCDKFSIRYRKTGATLKTLTDKIHEKLLKNHQNNINTLLIIDEAQHLQADALEQLRLLTNLETDTKKLLQVILIGQPELQQLLQRHDLRQLAQRITARYHLMPLNKQEVGQYIQHRLSVAQCSRTLFNASAITMVHRLSQGIPRLINLLCDRALINAFSSNNSVVNKNLVLKSSREALGSEYQFNPWYQQSSVQMISLVISLLMVLAIGVSIGVYKKADDFNDKRVVKRANVIIADESVVIKQQPEDQQVINQLAIEQKVTTDNSFESAHIREESIQKDNAKAQATVEFIADSVVQTQPSIEASNKIANNVTTQATTEVNPKPVSIEAIELKPAEGVSEELLKRFQSAIEQTAASDTEHIVSEVNKSVKIKPLHQMPSWVQQGVGRLQFDMHIYATDNEGWVRVNGRDTYQGENINKDLIIKEILPQKMILTYLGEDFSLPALSSW